MLIKVNVNYHQVIARQWRAEAVGCPVPTRFLDALENIFYSSRKISDNLFLVVHQIFLSFIQILYFFALAVKFYENSILGCPPVLHHAPVRTFFSSFLVIYLHFSYENCLLGCPPGRMPGAVAPSAPPLHATVAREIFGKVGFREFPLVLAVSLWTFRFS